jgi:hypothetical protein
MKRQAQSQWMGHGGIVGLPADRFLGLPSVAALPTAAAVYQGAVVVIKGDSGVADALYVCQKDATDSYVWSALGGGGGASGGADGAFVLMLGGM